MSDALVVLAQGALGTAAVFLAKAVYEKARRKTGGAMEHRMKTAEDNLHDLGATVHKLRTTVQAHDSSIAVINARLVGIERGQERVEAKLDRLDDKLDRALER